MLEAVLLAALGVVEGVVLVHLCAVVVGEPARPLPAHLRLLSLSLASPRLPPVLLPQQQQSPLPDHRAVAVAPGGASVAAGGVVEGEAQGRRRLGRALWLRLGAMNTRSRVPQEETCLEVCSRCREVHAGGRWASAYFRRSGLGRGQHCTVLAARSGQHTFEMLRPYPDFRTSLSAPSSPLSILVFFFLVQQHRICVSVIFLSRAFWLFPLLR